MGDRSSDDLTGKGNPNMERREFLKRVGLLGGGLAGMSILQYAGSSEGANAYRALAKAVIKRAPAPPVEAPKQPVASRV